MPTPSLPTPSLPGPLVGFRTVIVFCRTIDPRVAVIVAVPGVVPAVILNGALVAPLGTTTLAGTVATARFVDSKETEI